MPDTHPQRQNPSGTGALLTGSPELRELLNSYACQQDEIRQKNRITALIPHWAPGWLKIPASRWLVRILFVRRVHRCIAALKTAVTRRGGVGFDVAAKKQDIELLDQFDQSLPSNPKLSRILPLCLVALFSGAYFISILNRDSDSRLFGELTPAAVKLDPNAVLAAFATSRHWAKFDVFPWWLILLGAAAELSAAAGILSAILVRPAFGIHRQIRDQLAVAEKRAFTVTGAPRVDETELDLLAWALLIPPAALPMLVVFWVEAHAVDNIGFSATISSDKDLLIAAAFLTSLPIAAALELRRRYNARRVLISQAHSCIRRAGRVVGSVSLILTGVITLVISSGAGKPHMFPDTRELSVWSPENFSEVGSVDGDVSFAITVIQLHAPCDDPHPPTIRDAQYLRFVVEAWSRFDEFVDPAEAQTLTLSHWSVLNSQRWPIAAHLYLHPRCSHGVDGIQTPLTPGVRTVADVVVSAPEKDAAYLQLVVPFHQSTFRWKIP